jgi:5-methylcytosine-specific restriction endonuclease McrA
MRPCLDCDRLVDATRCDTCRRARERKRKRPAYRRKYGDPVYQANRRTLLASATTCTICNHPPHRGAALEIDHIQPISTGGGNDLNNLRVVCRPCNNALRAGTIPQPPLEPPQSLHMRY